MHDFEQRLLVRRTRRAPAEFVGVFQLLEKLYGIVDAVDPEFQRGDVPRGERD